MPPGVHGEPMDTAATIDAIGGRIHPVTGEQDDYDELLELIGGRSVVLIGEASHGSHEFYAERARLTRRLIDEHGFTAVAVEADWPDAYRVNRYVMGQSPDPTADAALSDFRRFPAWMWRNRDVSDFVRWLRVHNAMRSHPSQRTGFYGLDLYSLRASMEAVIEYLDRVDPSEAGRARERYGCFDHVGAEGQAYGWALAHQAAVPCEHEVVAQLRSLHARSELYLRQDGWVAEDEQFHAEQNALVVHDAEQYYQQMYRAEVSSWNLRDQHMARTLDALVHHLEHQFGHAKVVVWAHNSHVGDARATSMSERGELNVGQLVRERWGDRSALIGMTTHEGWVTAASDWGGPMERKRVRTSLADSHEAVFHDVARATGVDRYWVATGDTAVHDALAAPRLERAVGVVYRPRTERDSHYLHARLADQFDAVVHVDRTSALEPLDPTSLWDRGEPAETYPTGV